MKRNITILVMSMISYLCSFAYTPCTTCPKDNPMATHYADSGDYAFWTDEINWSNVVDMSAYTNGSTTLAKFQNARDEMYAVGGGVLYYPAGTYTFDISDGPADEGLMLKKGVVIRGATPSSDKKAVTSYAISTMTATDHGLKSLGTRFVFTTKTIQGGPVPKMWNIIGCKKGTNESNLGQVSHVGVAWVNIEYGLIYFGLDNVRWAASYATSGSFIGAGAVASTGWNNRVPNGTHPLDLFAGTSVWGQDTAILGSKRFVFGCNLINAGVGNYVINKSGSLNFVGDPNPFAWTGRIAVYGAHLFVANNVIAKPTASFNNFNWTCKGGGDSDVGAGITIATRFDYGYGIGIDVNKSGASGFGNRCAIENPIGSIYYSPDVIIQDNFIYNHGNKSIDVAGKYMVVKGNVMRRDFYGFNDNVYSLGAVSYGVNWSNGRCYNAESTTDMMSRAGDLGGWNIWVSKNFYRSTGTNWSNDGEGLLCQRHNGVEVYSWAETQNIHCICSGDNTYIAPYDVHCIGLFQAWNKQGVGTAGINAVRSNWAEDISVPEDLNFNAAGTVTPPVGTNGIKVKDFLADCNLTVAAAQKPLNLKVVVDMVERVAMVTWQDNSSNEMAYKVEKRKVGASSWTTMAYRPRQQTTSTLPLSDTAISSKTFGYDKTYGKCHPSTVTIDQMNPTNWADYKYNVMYQFEYRVIAIDCDNDADAASYVVTGLTEKYSDIIKTLTLKISPNPVRGNAIIEYSINDNEKATVEVLDMNGRQVLVLASETLSKSVTLPSGILKKGTYLVKVTSNQGSSIVDKMIIE